MNTTPPTAEERIWSVLAHLSALAFGMGILLPIIGWSEQRRKSKYVSFQCLQALGFQSLGFTVWLLTYLVILIVILFMIVGMSFQAENAGRPFDPMEGPLILLVYVSTFGFIALYVLLPVVASIACALGKDFRYPILGNRLARFLGYQPASDNPSQLTEDNEERWVSAMGHFAVIILLWGLLAPLTTWILQGKRNGFLKFQSIQTSIYQIIVTVLYFAAIVIYMIGFLAFIAATGLTGVPTDGAPFGLISVGIFFLFSLIALVSFAIVPLFHILGQWAGYRVLKGENYRYPIVGKLVERRLKLPDQLPAAAEFSKENAL